MQDELSRIPGVGDVNVFGSPYAMRIWLDPHKLAELPADAERRRSPRSRTRIPKSRRARSAACRSREGQMLNATVTAQSRLQTPEQFRNIIVKTDPSGARVLLGDVARVELGADNYSARIRANGHPGAGIGISLAPGADALSTAELVKAKVAEIAPRMPAGYAYAYANDTTDFIKLSVKEVVKTLIEAIVLVVLVMFVFLQSWRATLIPAIAVPVVLLGTFAVLYALGFSINTMTLFGLVLAIGLLVDDAIVVVENVERLMDENPEMTPREATITSMEEIQIALIAIALVLSAVFLPMVFFGGSTGVIYRQFSATIVSAMVLSVFVALILSPALAANLLAAQPCDRRGNLARAKGARGSPTRSSAGGVKFNHGFERLIHWYVGTVHRVVDRKWLFLGIYAGVVALLMLLFFRLPTGFLPTEDQGAALDPVPAAGRRDHDPDARGPARRSRIISCKGRRRRTSRPISPSPAAARARRARTPARASSTSPIATSARARKNTADAIVAARIRRVPRPARRAGLRARARRDPRPWPVDRLHHGAAEHRRHDAEQDFAAARDKLLAAANADPKLTSVRLSELPDVASLKVDIDQQRLAALGLNSGDVNNTLSTAWGGRYVNDFIDRGRVKRVYVQGDAPYRAEPERHRPMVRPQQPGRDGALLLLRADRLDDDADQPVALPRLSVLRDLRARPRRA